MWFSGYTCLLELCLCIIMLICMYGIVLILEGVNCVCIYMYTYVCILLYDYVLYV